MAWTGPVHCTGIPKDYRRLGYSQPANIKYYAPRPLPDSPSQQSRPTTQPSAEEKKRRQKRHFKRAVFVQLGLAATLFILGIAVLWFPIPQPDTDSCSGYLFSNFDFSMIWGSLWLILTASVGLRAIRGDNQSIPLMIAYFVLEIIACLICVVMCIICATWAVINSGDHHYPQQRTIPMVINLWGVFLALTAFMVSLLKSCMICWNCWLTCCACCRRQEESQNAPPNNATVYTSNQAEAAVLPSAPLMIQDEPKPQPPMAPGYFASEPPPPYPGPPLRAPT